MKLLSSVTVLRCEDINTTLQYYQQIFQFVIVKQRKVDNGIVWVQIQSGDIQLMLELNTSNPNNFQSSRLYFYTDDVSNFHHFVLAKGKQAGTLRTTKYGMSEFDLLDPDGHEITVGEVSTTGTG